MRADRIIRLIRWLLVLMLMLMFLLAALAYWAGSLFSTHSFSFIPLPFYFGIFCCCCRCCCCCRYAVAFFSYSLVAPRCRPGRVSVMNGPATSWTPAATNFPDIIYLSCFVFKYNKIWINNSSFPSPPLLLPGVLWWSPLFSWSTWLDPCEGKKEGKKEGRKAEEEEGRVLETRAESIAQRTPSSFDDKVIRAAVNDKDQCDFGSAN